MPKASEIGNQPFLWLEKYYELFKEEDINEGVNEKKLDIVWWYGRKVVHLSCIYIFFYSNMAFEWKEHKNIWKGEGIYFLTFNVVGRQKLLGSLTSISDSRFYLRNVQRSLDMDEKWDAMHTNQLATVMLTPLGFAVSQELRALSTRVYGLMLCAKQVMPDHIHAVVWIRKDCGRTIRQIGNGFRIGIKKKAIELGVWESEAGHILDIPYIRTLAHKGQLKSMINYVHANPDNAWLRKLTPELYTIRRNIQLSGLTFDGMGKERLLSYPDRQVIALSRSLTKQQIDEAVSRALYNAEKGAITYTAAINEGEKAISKAIRTHGYPLVVMLLEGFPAEDTEAARYFHPHGVYHKLCGEGILMLLSPIPSNYQNPTLIQLTDAELERKANQKGLHYSPIPHESKRWRMIAGNIMLRMIAEEG